MDKTIRESAMLTIVDKMTRAQDEVNKNNDLVSQLHAAASILNGCKGYLIAPFNNGNHGITRGFTSFEEVIGFIGNPMFYVSLSPVDVSPGQVLFEVSPINGMLN